MNEGADKGPIYCTTAQLCQRLNVGRTTLWRWQRERKFPEPKRLGARLVRYRMADVDKWLDQQA